MYVSGNLKSTQDGSRDWLLTKRTVIIALIYFLTPIQKYCQLWELYDPFIHSSMCPFIHCPTSYSSRQSSMHSSLHHHHFVHSIILSFEHLSPLIQISTMVHLYIQTFIHPTTRYSNLVGSTLLNSWVIKLKYFSMRVLLLRKQKNKVIFKAQYI